MKKILIIIFILGLIFFVFSLVLFLIKPKAPTSTIKTEPTPTPVHIKEPYPTNIQSNPTLIEQYNAEKDYAEQRKKVLDDKPWLLKLPLQGSDYFIVYDTEKNQFIADIYSVPLVDPEIKQQQLLEAKKRALSAIEGLGANLNQEKVVFIEGERK
jgi:hypothetical protein